MTNGSDYHVVSLTYSVKGTKDVTYDSPPPVAFETSEARFHLAETKLTCHLKIHLATEAEARAVVEPLLRAWEVDAGLRQGRAEVQFQFESSELIDRTPLPPGTVGVPSAQLRLTAHTATVASLSTHVTRRTYPEPPGDFRITPDVETLWNRYDGYREGREPLPAMGYFCFTVLVTFAGGRAKAAAKYKIDEPVLRKLGELTLVVIFLAVRGSPRMQPLSSNEDAWIQETIKQIIWRLGDQRSPATLPTITMAALPRL